MNDEVIFNFGQNFEMAAAIIYQPKLQIYS